MLFLGGLSELGRVANRLPSFAHSSSHTQLRQLADFPSLNLRSSLKQKNFLLGYVVRFFSSYIRLFSSSAALCPLYLLWVVLKL